MHLLSAVEIATYEAAHPGEPSELIHTELAKVALTGTALTWSGTSTVRVSVVGPRAVQAERAIPDKARILRVRTVAVSDA